MARQNPLTTQTEEPTNEEAYLQDLVQYYTELIGSSKNILTLSQNPSIQKLAKATLATANIELDAARKMLDNGVSVASHRIPVRSPMLRVRRL